MYKYYLPANVSERYIRLCCRAQLCRDLERRRFSLLKATARIFYIMRPSRMSDACVVHASRRLFPSRSLASAGAEQDGLDIPPPRGSFGRRRSSFAAEMDAGMGRAAEAPAVDPQDATPWPPHHRRQSVITHNSQDARQQSDMFALLGSDEPRARYSRPTEGADAANKKCKRLDAQHPAAHLVSEERFAGGRDALDEWIVRRHSNKNGPHRKQAADSVRTQDAMLTNMLLLKRDVAALRAPLPPSSRVLALAKPQHMKLPVRGAGASAPAWSYGALGGPNWSG